MHACNMRAFDAVLQLLYPDAVTCWACGREAMLSHDKLCEDCSIAISRAPQRIPCPDALDGLTAGLCYNEAVESAMHRFKYRNEIWLAPYFAEGIELPSDWEIDCLAPVPLHPLREWKRSYNQSELLCRAIVKRYPYAVRTDLIRRVRYTRQQARLSAEERAKNIRGAFCANTNATGLSIVLVDDVTTTHGTLVECAKALRHAGAKRVYAACACIAGYGGQK